MLGLNYLTSFILYFGQKNFSNNNNDNNNNNNKLTTFNHWYIKCCIYYIVTVFHEIMRTEWKSGRIYEERE